MATKNTPSPPQLRLTLGFWRLQATSKRNGRLGACRDNSNEDVAVLMRTLEALETSKQAPFSLGRGHRRTRGTDTVLDKRGSSSLNGSMSRHVTPRHTITLSYPRLGVLDKAMYRRRRLLTSSDRGRRHVGVLAWRSHLQIPCAAPVPFQAYSLHIPSWLPATA